MTLKQKEKYYSDWKDDIFAQIRGEKKGLSIVSREDSNLLKVLKRRLRDVDALEKADKE